MLYLYHNPNPPGGGQKINYLPGKNQEKKGTKNGAAAAALEPRTLRTPSEPPAHQATCVVLANIGFPCPYLPSYDDAMALFGDSLFFSIEEP